MRQNLRFFLLIIGIYFAFSSKIYSQSVVIDSVFAPVIADSYIYKSSSYYSYNYGGAPVIRLRHTTSSTGSGYNIAGFLKFALTPSSYIDEKSIAKSIPIGAVIDSVKLKAFVLRAQYSTNATTKVTDSLIFYATSSNSNNTTGNSWIEGTSTGAAVTDGSLTINNAPDSVLPAITRTNLVKVPVGDGTYYASGTNAPNVWAYYSGFLEAYKNAFTDDNIDNDTISLEIFPTYYSASSNETNFASKENSDGNASKLVIYYHTLSTTPVTLSSLSGSITNEKNVLLKWNTISEINSSIFHIQRSTNGVDFVTIDSIEAAGNSMHSIAYTYVDQNPLSGTNYYRVKEIDLDGAYQFSNIISIKANGSFKIYPNPIKKGNDITITTNTKNTDKKTFKFFEVSGKLDYTFTTIKNSNIINISTSKLHEGVYLMNIYDASNRLLSTSKIIIE